MPFGSKLLRLPIMLRSLCLVLVEVISLIKVTHLLMWSLLPLVIKTTCLPIQWSCTSSLPLPVSLLRLYSCLSLLLILSTSSLLSLPVFLGLQLILRMSLSTLQGMMKAWLLFRHLGLVLLTLLSQLLFISLLLRLTIILAVSGVTVCSSLDGLLLLLYMVLSSFRIRVIVIVWDWRLLRLQFRLLLLLSRSITMLHLEEQGVLGLVLLKFK